MSTVLAIFDLEQQEIDAHAEILRQIVEAGEILPQSLPQSLPEEAEPELLEICLG